MNPIYTDSEFQAAKTLQYLPLKCKQCGKKFFRQKKYILRFIRKKQNNNGKSFEFCSNKCFSSSKDQRISLKCKNCNNIFLKERCKIKRTKNHFCSQSCAAIYNNTHKTKGNRRSKLEVWLEEQLPSLFPDLKIDYNQKDAINSELDIYVPSLSLAFELNGIFHYEPIYGMKKLSQVQNNDNRKMQACLEKNIELCIIDVSGMKYFKPKNAQKYLDIISSIIDLKLSTS